MKTRIFQKKGTGAIYYVVIECHATELDDIVIGKSVTRPRQLGVMERPPSLELPE